MRRKYRFSVMGLVCLLCFCVIGCAMTGINEKKTRNLDILQSWSGLFPVDQLDLLPDGQRQSRTGYIGNKRIFTIVWQTFMPDQMIPKVDFKRHLVVFSRNVVYFNRTRIFKVTLTGGEAEILAMETMSAIPIEDKLAMALAVVPRAGIEFILSGGHRVPVTPP